MSIWSFLGEFALIDAICKLFSGSGKRGRAAASYVTPQLPPASDARVEEYYRRRIAEIEERYGEMVRLQQLIDDLELQLVDMDVEEDLYDEIEDEIDRLQERVDTLEEIELLEDELDEIGD